MVYLVVPKEVVHEPVDVLSDAFESKMPVDMGIAESSDGKTDLGKLLDSIAADATPTPNATGTGLSYESTAVTPVRIESFRSSPARGPSRECAIG